MISDTAGPSALEPVVLTSRFISCSRKSSLRPHGSGESLQRLPVLEVAAEPHDLLGDVRAADELRDLLGDQRLVGQRVGAQLAHPLVQPRLQAGHPCSGGRATCVEQLAEQRAPRIEVGPQIAAFADAHRVELVERRADGLLDQRPTSGARRPRRRPRPFSRIASACGKRSRSPGVITPVDVAPLARPLERAAERVEERFVQLDVERRRPPLLHDDRRPRRGRAPTRLWTSARSRVSSGRERRRHAQLQIEEPVVDRP